MEFIISGILAVVVVLCFKKYLLNSPTDSVLHKRVLFIIGIIVVLGTIGLSSFKTTRAAISGSQAFESQVWTEHNKMVKVFQHGGVIRYFNNCTVKFDRSSTWVNIITSDGESIIINTSGSMTLIENAR